MTSIKQIQKDKLLAMKAKQSATVSTLNLLMAEIEKEMKLTGATDLTEDQVITVINRQIKKLDKEMEAYVAVGRGTEKQEAEKELLISYLPVQASQEEIVEAVKKIAQTTKETGGTIGQAMKQVSSLLKGKADMKKVSELMRGEFK